MQIHHAWFPEDEYLHRLERVQQSLQSRGLAALLLFQPESICYLSGFHTPDLGAFQCAIVPAVGLPRVLCRDDSRYQLDASCVFPDVSCWGGQHNPLVLVAQIVHPLVGRGERLGVEMSGQHLSAAQYLHLQELLNDLRLEAADDILQGLRWRKSLTELACHRRAAQAVDMALETAATAVEAGMSERELAAQICAALVEAGSDQPGPIYLCAGERALYPYGVYSDREIQPQEVLLLELSAGVRYYQARCLRPLALGHIRDADRRLAETLLSLQDEALAAVRPSVPATVPEAIYQDGLQRLGLGNTAQESGFVSLGLLFGPQGSEGLASGPHCNWLFEEHMVFHTRLQAQGMGFSETIVVNADGYERLTQFPRHLIAR